MGEIAEMMLDGTLCECCGTFIDDEGADGSARYCSDQCARDRGASGLTFTRREKHARTTPARTNCPVCNKRVKAAGLRDHMRDVHDDDRRKLFVAGFCAALGLPDEAHLSENRSQALAVAWAQQ